MITISRIIFLMFQIDNLQSHHQTDLKKNVTSNDSDVQIEKSKK